MSRKDRKRRAQQRDGRVYVKLKRRFVNRFEGESHAKKLRKRLARQRRRRDCLLHQPVVEGLDWGGDEG